MPPGALMNFKMLPLLALINLPAAAQDRWQINLGWDHLAEAKETDSDAATMVLAKRSDGRLASLQVGYRFADFPASDLSVTAEHQFRKTFSSAIQARGPLSPPDQSGQISKQTFSPGIQWNFHRTFDYGFGLQARFERLEATVGAWNPSTTYFRPWLNLYLGYTFQTGSRVRPTIGLRSSGALLTTEAPSLVRAGDDAPTRKRLLRAMAGDGEASLQVGLRF